MLGEGDDSELRVHPGPTQHGIVQTEGCERVGALVKTGPSSAVGGGVGRWNEGLRRLVALHAELRVEVLGDCEAPWKFDSESG